jgi:hypothetical protein
MTENQKTNNTEINCERIEKLEAEDGRLKPQIEALERLITGYQESYYNGESEISDREFDKLLDELRRLSLNSSLLSREKHRMKTTELAAPKKVYAERDMTDAVDNEGVALKDIIATPNITVQIDYIERDGSILERVVDVKKIVASSWGFSVHGHCRLRNGYVSFSLSSIAAVWENERKFSSYEFVDNQCKNNEKYHEIKQKIFINGWLSMASDCGMETSLLVYIARLGGGGFDKKDRKTVAQYLMEKYNIKEMGPEEFEERLRKYGFNIPDNSFKDIAKLVKITDDLISCARKLARTNPAKREAVGKLIYGPDYTYTEPENPPAAFDLASEAMKD